MGYKLFDTITGIYIKQEKVELMANNVIMQH